MCGIAGFVGAGGIAALEGMLAALIHRGPDGQGHYTDAGHAVYIGQRRLAVLDILGGAQPMWNEDRTVAVIFNGEIYNHRDLRSQLVAAGHRFASDHSDTEVLVHGYEEWGENLPTRLNGMFAFAIYDARAKQLFLSRDRFGKKPLFYCEVPGFFGFASELPALLGHPEVPQSYDVTGIAKYFAYGLFPAPYTPWRAIRKLPGGHHLTFDLSSRRITTSRYWRYITDPVAAARSEPCLIEELRAMLAMAVRRRLESDVPLGLLLSGGIDSSAILALVAEARPASSIDAFSISFQQPSFDESQFARRMARHVGCNHHVKLCDFSQGFGSLTDFFQRVGEPVADSSIVPTNLLCQFARSRVTVALGGDGGDELFAGYDTFAALGPSSQYQRYVPRWAHAAFQQIVAGLPFSDQNISLDFKLRRWLRGLEQPAPYWCPLWMGAATPSEVASLTGHHASLEELYSEALAVWAASESVSLIDRAADFYANFYLQDGVLVKVDRASMQNSLEVRSPFLDNDVVEFARRLPAQFKVRHGQRKYLLRQALRGLVPEEIANRPKKGFGIPLSAWLRRLPFPELDLPAVDMEWMRRRWDAHLAEQEDNRHLMWCWLSLTALARGTLAPRADMFARS